MPWYVLYTKPRNEKKTAKLLEEKGIEVYCPVREVMKQWSDRKKKVAEPVFPSYIFVRLEDYSQEQTSVLMTPGAVRFLFWLKKPGVVRDEEIIAIRQFLDDYREAEITVNFSEGDNVVVTVGPLKEQQGQLLKIRGNKATLQVRSLGWNITAELPLQAITRSNPKN